MDKYEAMREFIKENFMTTTDKRDRLHTETIINILNNNKYLFSTCKMAQVFKSMNIGKHANSITINHKEKAGYYNIIYRGKS